MRTFNFCSTADLHIGKYRYGRQSKKTGMDTSLLSTLRCFDEFVDYSIKKNVDFVLINGDLAKRKTLSELERSEFFKRVKRLRDAGIDVYILIGNHDASFAKGTAHNIKSIKVLDMEGVHIIDKPEVVKRDECNLILMPFIEHVDDWVIEYKKLRKKIWKSKKKIVVALHGNVNGVAHHFSELMESDEPNDIPTDIFDDECVIYVACGHQHRHQVVQEDPVVEYSGSLDRVSFEERNDKKGFVYCRVKGDKLKRKFIEVNARKFIQIAIDSKKLPNINFKKAIVKVVLNNVKRDFDAYDKEDIQRQLIEKGAKFVIIKKKIVKRVESQRINTTGSVSFKKRIDDWCDVNIDKDLQDSVKSSAMQILDQVG